MPAFRRSSLTSQIKTNMVMRLNQLLLDNGFYNNVDKGETDFLNNDLSSFRYNGSSQTFPGGQSWLAPHNSWVYEGDANVPVGATPPIPASGIHINGVFYPPSHVNYGHVFNHYDGEVIFTSGMFPASTDTVQGNYSYKEFSVSLAAPQHRFALNNAFFDNDSISDDIFPSGLQSNVGVWVDVVDGEVKPKALGGGINVFKTLHIHCVGSDRAADAIDNLADKILYMQYEKLPLIDVDSIPETLDWRGAKSSTYQDYTTMLSTVPKYGGLYCVKADRVDIPTNKQNFYHVRIDMLWQMFGAPQ